MTAYEKRVEKGLEGLTAVSIGPCPHCRECASSRGMKLKQFDAAYEAGRIPAEAGFSWRPCGICGSSLGGDREEWHAILDGNVVHFDDACVDCVMYLANGDLPDAANE